MADSPLKQKLDLCSYSVLVGGKETPGIYNVLEIEVKKEINKISSATVVLLDGSPADANFELSEKDLFKPGTDIKITAGYHQTEETVFEGIIVGHGIRIKEEDMSELVVRCVDKAAKMTVERKNRYFAESTDSDAMGKVIGDHGLSKDVQATSLKHERMVQFDSTDWDFLISRAEMNGFVVVVDDNKVSVAKPATKKDVLALTYGRDIQKLDLELDARYQLPGVKTESWDLSKNEVVSASSKEPTANSQGNIDGKKLSSVLASKTNKMHSTGPVDKKELEDWANARLIKARFSRVRGKIKFVGSAKPKPNTTVELKGLGTRFNGSAYISGVYHRMKDHSWDTEISVGMSPHFFAETQPDIMTPPSSGMMPAVSGLQIGVVKKIDADPQGETRIQVDVPMIEPSGDGLWARQTTYYATKEAGNFFMPEIGDEVVLGFLNDDPRYPVIIGSVYSKKHMPAYKPDDKNTYKAITTNSKMKIEFEDVKKIITIWTPADNQIVISDDEKSITISDQTGNKIVMDTKGISITTPKDLTIKADGLIKMEAMKTITVKATQDLSMEGMNINSKAKVANSMKGATAEVNGSGQTTIKGGMVMIN